MRIMYVEDNMVNLALVERVARMGGHTILSYKNGVEALKALENEQVDLILMDIELDGELDGMEVTRRLRARGDKRPIVAVTAYAMRGDKERILEAGCDDYLPKPIPIVDFLQILAKYDPSNVKPEPVPPIEVTNAEPSVIRGGTSAAVTPTSDTAPSVEKPTAAAESQPEVSQEDASTSSVEKNVESEPISAQDVPSEKKEAESAATTAVIPDDKTDVKDSSTAEEAVSPTSEEKDRTTVTSNSEATVEKNSTTSQPPSSEESKELASTDEETISSTPALQQPTTEVDEEKTATATESIKSSDSKNMTEVKDD